jgi:hypothetical protein
MRRIVLLVLVAVLMVVAMALSASTAFAGGNGGGWGPCKDETNRTAVGAPEPDDSCGRKEGASSGGHTPGTPNGFCSPTFRESYECNNEYR